MSTFKKILIAVIVVLILAICAVSVIFYLDSRGLGPGWFEKRTTATSVVSPNAESSAAESGDTVQAKDQARDKEDVPAVISAETEYWFRPLEKFWKEHKTEIIVVSALLIALFVLIAVIVSIVMKKPSSRNTGYY